MPSTVNSIKHTPYNMMKWPNIFSLLYALILCYPLDVYAGVKMDVVATERNNWSPLGLSYYGTLYIDLMDHPVREKDTPVVRDPPLDKAENIKISVLVYHLNIPNGRHSETKIIKNPYLGEIRKAGDYIDAAGIGFIIFPNVWFGTYQDNRIAHVHITIENADVSYKSYYSGTFTYSADIPDGPDACSIQAISGGDLVFIHDEVITRPGGGGSFRSDKIKIDCLVESSLELSLVGSSIKLSNAALTHHLDINRTGDSYVILPSVTSTVLDVESLVSWTDSDSAAGVFYGSGVLVIAPY
ncbi:hypothetical protein HCO69_19590 [Pantoea sp. LS15]|uniref:hypothetical protein n=1 Tax=Enterobacterales TaxID=91347 RepID=UPI000E0FCCCC|nr:MULTISPECIES: hypothetical protein [Enterobacterales]NJQ21816.1 hypothetical protein [Pantoea sp. LS15]NKF48412.1 hypothetical protein [Pantoea sp. LS15]RDK12970.1 hypothetical protein CEJ32_20050 [Enterobacter sp. 9-2]